MPSNNAKITSAQREEILNTFLQDPAVAQVQATSLGLEPQYPLKLARMRGLVPRTSKRWGKLMESA